jgi:hypothetical protein
MELKINLMVLLTLREEEKILQIKVHGGGCPRRDSKLSKRAINSPASLWPPAESSEKR